MIAVDFRNRVKRLNKEIPAAQFKEFQNAIIKELALELNMPINLDAGDSLDYNYASARENHRNFKRMIAKHSHLEAK